ncbi:MAG: tetratricopeptide repeat protein [Bacteroidales bacterium]|nr:tetratricopeptide repeat protein [Bacteroidales bacterium]
MNYKLFVFSLILVFQINGFLAFAQKSINETLSDKNYSVAHDLFQKEKYSAAQFYFNKYLEYAGIEDENRVNAEYYSSICAIELFNEDAEYLIRNFINNNRESTKVTDAYLKMALFKFRDLKPQSLKEAAQWFDMVEVKNLSNEELAEYHFKSGYTSFALEDYPKAKKSFFEIKDGNNKYQSPALYYYSHLNYLEKNYQTALEGFTKLSEDEMFAPIAPYYIAQIYYLQKNYAKVIEYGPALLDSVGTRRQAEIARIVGESFYKTMRFKESIPYLQMFKEKAKTFTRDDIYQLGYAYYRAGDFVHASENLEKSVNLTDALSQNAYFLLADCYLKTNSKNNARLAFSAASKMDFDKRIKEDAAYNYAKITYELSFSPFNESLRAITEFVRNYPNSPKLDEMYGYLSNVYMTTKNYRQAMEALENIQKVNAFTEETYQKVAFFRGLELFKNKQWEDAIINFDKSLNNAKYNEVYKAQSLYWKAESYYRLERYKDALTYYEKFSKSAGAIGTDEFKMVDYNSGYCNFKLEDYKKAMISFRKFLTANENVNNAFVCDANARVGDCFYTDKKFDLAVEYYSKSIEIGLAATDYALYQKGISQGLNTDGYNSLNMKIVTLTELILSYPNSPYIDDALFEQGRAYVATDAQDMALVSFQQLIDEHPKSEYYPKALLQIASIHQFREDWDLAIETYTKVFERDKTSPDGKTAYAQLEKILADNNKVSEIEKLNVDISEEKKDSLAFFPAEKLFLVEGNLVEAEKRFKEYINKYPNGKYLVKVHYYKSVCDIKNNNEDDALVSYEFLMKANKNDYSEEAARQSAQIYYKRKEYEKALNSYIKLEQLAHNTDNIVIALMGQMRSQYNLGKYYEAIISAEKTLNLEKLDENQKREIHHIKGLSYYANNELEPAIEEFMFISQATRTSQGAEAKYMVALIFYKQELYDVAEREIFDFASKGTDYQYWLGKSFLLGSDVFMAKNDNYQAKATLQSILDNYSIKDDGIIDEAREKLNKIILLESKPKTESSENEIQINIEKSSLENSLLPDENIKPEEEPEENIENE